MATLLSIHDPNDPGAGVAVDGSCTVDDIAAQSCITLGVPRCVAARGFVGNNLAHRAPGSLRAVAFQGRSRLASGDAELSARRFGRYLASLEADLVLILESGIRDGTSRLRQFKATLRSVFGWIAYNHYPAHLPHGKGVMLLTRVEYPAKARSISRDSQARGIAASFSFPAATQAAGTARISVTMRAIAGYGVTGWTLREAAPDENDKLKDWLVGELQGAADLDVPVLLGMDVNAILSANYDCIGSSASPRRGSIAEALADAGCRCSFRQFFPAMQVGSRLCQSGATFLTRIFLRATPVVRAAAAAVHWRHGMSTDHAPMVTDVVGVCAHRVRTVDTLSCGTGVESPVP